jgi:predicted metal-dependent hydrolase
MSLSQQPIEVRNRRFELDERVPRHWHGGRRAVSIFFDNLSTFFPAGERFFIASVRAYRGSVKDDALLAAVKAFSAQEGIHTREHVRYNEMLRARGYPIEELERNVELLLAFVTKVAPKRWQLSATCALEHFTALMGHMILAEPRALEGAAPSMAALWRWHAAEENEHKAVAFDVYRAAEGPYAERAFVMFLATVIFWGKVLEHQVKMMRADGILFSAREWADLVTFLFVEPACLGKLIPHYFQYYRPGFHPWDHDNRDLLEGWKTMGAEVGG